MKQKCCDKKLFIPITFLTTLKNNKLQQVYFFKKSCKYTFFIKNKLLIAYIRISFLIWCSNENLYWANQNKRQILWKKSWFPDTRFGCFNRIDFNLLYDYQVREGEKSLPYQNQTKVDRSMAVQRRKYFRPSGTYRDSWVDTGQYFQKGRLNL